MSVLALGVVGIFAVVAFIISVVLVSTKSNSAGGKLTNPVLVHPRAENATAARPTVEVQGGLPGITAATLTSNSTDTSGRIDGKTTAGSSGQLRVRFGTPFAVEPAAVVLSPSGTSTEYTVQPYVASLDVTGFTLIATPSTTLNSVTNLLYYIVL